MGLRRLFIGCGMVVVTALSALAAYSIASQSAIERTHEATLHRLDMVEAELQGGLKRFEYLPSLLEHIPGVMTLFDSPKNLVMQDNINRLLKNITITSGTSTIYLLANSGISVATSDWDEASSSLGVNYSFRPYVKEARVNGRGHFYGVGVTSNHAGYYLSYVLNHQAKPRGMAIVKVNLENLETAWKKLPGIVLLTDARGVVILSSRQDWKFRPLIPLPESVINSIAVTRPYGDASLKPLEWHHLATQSDATSATVRVLDTDYLSSTRDLPLNGWRIIMLDELAPTRAAARNSALIVALAVSVLLLIASLLVQSQRAVKSKLANRAALQAAHDSLEHKVIERTGELQGVNESLAKEIEARKTIEANLRATQNELIHASKMAALGEMSAGMVHELNQPLGALRTLSDNARVLLEQDRVPDVHDNLQRIALLVDRLGRLTFQLKAFSHKTQTPCVPVSVQQVITNAQFFISQRLREHGVALHVQVTPSTLMTLAEESRLEQVIVNLMNNAIDAMNNVPKRHLWVSAESTNGLCCIKIIDSGLGIRADIMPRLFEPFNTSKPAGAGLGLGLMISAHIIREFGGIMKANNRETGGAQFTIELPLATTIKEI